MLGGVKLILTLVTFIYPEPVAESWSLFGAYLNDTCGVNETCPGEEARGVFPRPGFLDRIAEKARSGQWGWLVRVAWQFSGSILEQGIIWCGTLSDFVGVAASWSYWLMVGVVAVFLLQLGVWTITWIILPIAQHSYALVQYLRGRAPWHEAASLHGLATFRPSWVGPRAGIEWTSAYIQQEVRGRGDSREPHDLLVTDGLAVARLRHGTLRGRTNRHGFKCACNGVHSSSHRYFRNQLESASCCVHLCAEDPCGAPEEEGWHVFASAVIPRNQAYDLQEAAGRGPLGRCMVATRFWGCRGCFCFSWFFKAMAWVLRKLFGCGCRRRGKEIPSAGSPTRHEDSETESEAELGEVCQAERIAMLQDGHVTPLSLKPCKDIRKGPGIRLLSSDCPYSSREELEKSGENFFFHACNHHRALYENHSHKKICVIDGCEAEAKTVRGGLRLCKLHAAKEEKVKKGVGTHQPDSAPKEKGVDLGDASAAQGDPIAGTAARLAPGADAGTPPQGNPFEAEGAKSDLPYEELGQYLRLLMQGKTTGQALADVMPVYGDPSVAWLNLRRAAAEYLPRLPDDYPSSARAARLGPPSQGADPDQEGLQTNYRSFARPNGFT